ncbi:hypothetical protein V8035_001078 [Vibrio vulnificus]
MKMLRLFLKNIITYFFLKYHKVDFNYGKVSLIGFPIIKKHPGSKIIIEDNVTIVSKTKGNIAGVNNKSLIATVTHGAKIELKYNSGLSGAKIVSASCITLGRNSGLGANSVVYDTDFHPVDAEKRRTQTSLNEADSKPVLIGDDVLIGAGSTILKGTIIGDKCVLGAASVVANKRLLKSTVYAGNPVKLIKKIL